MFHFLDKYASIPKDTRLKILDEGPDWVRVAYRGAGLYVPKSVGYKVALETYRKTANSLFSKAYGSG